jgi:hypothetical protein
MWPAKPGDILDKIHAIKWSPTMSEEDSKRNVQDFNRLFEEFITWAVEDLNANKNNPETVKFHQFLCAQLTEVGNNAVAMASLSYIFNPLILTSPRPRITNRVTP